jgi:predicted DNA-binding protein
MKTAISIPDATFEACEQLAKERGLKRSELYRLALEDFLEKHSDESIRASLIRAYGDGDPGVDPLFDAAQKRSALRLEWKE